MNVSKIALHRTFFLENPIERCFQLFIRAPQIIHNLFSPFIVLSTSFLKTNVHQMENDFSSLSRHTNVTNLSPTVGQAWLEVP